MQKYLFLFWLGCTAAVVAQPQTAFPEVDLGGKLYRSVFVSGPGALAAGDVRDLPDPPAKRLERYLSRRAAFASRLPPGQNSFEAAAQDAKKRLIERAIVSLVDLPDVERLAADYARAAVVRHEWRGADAPLEEAAHAEDALKREPAGALAPFLFVFIADRQRAAFEFFAEEQDVQGMAAAAKKYRTFLQRSRGAADPIFALIADDLDRRTYLYRPTPDHPRDFNPDT